MKFSGGEVEDVHFLGFVDVLADGPVFIQLQGIEHEGDESFDTLQLFAFLKGPLHEAGDAFFGNGAAVLGHAFQPLLHLLAEAGRKEGRRRNDE